MLTAGVKVFLKYPEESESFITILLQKATDETSNPDIRDRAYIYWRMLSSEPEKTKTVVLSDKPVLRDEGFGLDTGFLDEMVENIGMISSLVQKTPGELFKKEIAIDNANLKLFSSKLFIFL
jgi:AP-1 complex subunit beta-1